jgi:hypothetical protein
MAMDELHHYFADLEQQEKFSGVALITQGSVPLFTGAYASTPHPLPNFSPPSPRSN